MALNDEQLDLRCLVLRGELACFKLSIFEKGGRIFMPTTQRNNAGELSALIYGFCTPASSSPGR
jgi:hypothetical protein